MYPGCAVWVQKAQYTTYIYFCLLLPSVGASSSPSSISPKSDCVVGTPWAPAGAGSAWCVLCDTGVMSLLVSLPDIDGADGGGYGIRRGDVSANVGDIGGSCLSSS